MRKIGKKDPCHCGSGTTYESCCRGKDQSKQLLRAMNDPSIDWPYDEDEWTDDEVVDLVDSPTAADNRPQEEVSGDEMPQPPAGPSRYPQPPTADDIPAIGDEAVQIVEAWRTGAEACLREELTALYENGVADSLLPHLLAFMEEHPELFEQLGVEEEYLSYVSTQLNRIGQWASYKDLLLRIREEYPVMYSLKFGCLDYDLMVGLMLAGRADQVSLCFDFFHQYPDSHPLDACRVADLLAWTGMQEELFAFVQPLAIPMRETHGEAGAFAMQWRLFAEYPALLAAGVDPEAAAAQVMAVADTLPEQVRPRLDRDLLRREFEILRQPRDLPAYAACRTEQAVTAFYREVTWNYMAYLHADKGFPLVRARLLAQRMGDFLQLRPEGAKLKYPFRIPSERLEIWLHGECSDLSEADGIRVTPMIETLWHFADFLESRSLDDGEESDDLRDQSKRLFHMLEMPLWDDEVRSPTAQLLPKLGESLLTQAALEG